ncbi:hypothetical protein F2Q68_00001647 [Brassica cretica]|uniref:Uncharacterized protein n=1 Tax=Brassica cretica TaxID=69181 RepID=A0A8S9J7V6_BRACR|nr:hypothetical protein F2Q68_00001647 [Brassica cretica]
MVQSKTTCQAIKSHNLQPETRFGPEMMMMKRTKPKRKLKESPVSQPGKTQSPPSKHDLVAKRTGRSPNYMKGTSSSEARMENKKIFNQKNQTGKKESRSNKPGSRMVDENTAKANQVKQSGQAKVKQLADKYEEIVKQFHEYTVKFGAVLPSL